MEIRGLMCCGFWEISGISGYTTGRGAMTALLDHMSRSSMYSPACGAVLFTEANGNEQRKTPINYGGSFADYIRKHNLGTVTEAPEFYNPNSRNYVRSFIWAFDMPRFIAFYNTFKQIRIIPE